MTYLAPVPRTNKVAYEELARISAKVIKEYGALRVVECWIDESGPEASSYHATDARLASEEYSNFRGAAAHAKARRSCFLTLNGSTRRPGTPGWTSLRVTAHAVSGYAADVRWQAPHCGGLPSDAAKD
jgi:hypothetical protein